MFEEIVEKIKKYCLYQPRCHYEIEQKLEEFYLIDQAKEKILIELISQGYLNEQLFVESFVRGKITYKKWGKQKIISELKRKKISDKLIEIALKEVNFEHYYENMVSLASKYGKNTNKLNDYQSRYKVFRYLAQKGYETELINEYLNSLTK